MPTGYANFETHAIYYYSHPSSHFERLGLYQFCNKKKLSLHLWSSCVQTYSSSTKTICHVTKSFEVSMVKKTRTFDSLFSFTNQKKPRKIFFGKEGKNTHTHTHTHTSALPKNFIICTNNIISVWTTKLPRWYLTTYGSIMLLNSFIHCHDFMLYILGCWMT
jgi:hypothetical protein